MTEPAAPHRPSARRIAAYVTTFAVVAVATAVLFPRIALEARWRTHADTMRGCLVQTGDLRRTERCFRAHQRAVIRAQGLRRGITTLEGEAARNADVQAFCHNTMHTVGRSMQAAGLDPAQLPATLPKGVTWSGQCSSGFLHGYMQGLGRGRGRGAALVAASGRACGAMPVVNRNECIHALGHGLARTEDDRLTRANAWCTSLAPDLRAECGSGAIMELQLASDERYRAASGDVGLGPARRLTCDTLPEPYRATCLARRIVFATLTPKPPTLPHLARDVCGPARGVPRRRCYEAIGFLFFGRYSRPGEPIDPASRLCPTFTGPDAQACAYGSGLKWGYYGVLDVDEAVHRCERWTGEQRSSCVEGAARGHGAFLDAPAPARTCHDFPTRYATQCARGAATASRSPGLS